MHHREMNADDCPCCGPLLRELEACLEYLEKEVPSEPIQKKSGFRTRLRSAGKVVVLTVLTAAGCTPQVEPDCRVDGMAVYGAAVCADVDRAVALAVTALGNHVEGYSAAFLSTRLRSVGLLIGSPYNARHIHPYQADCDALTINLEQLEAGALTHEIAHIADNCSTPEHTGWAGQFEAIAEAEGAA